MNLRYGITALVLLSASVISGEAQAENPFATRHSQVTVGYGALDGPGGPDDPFSRNVQTLDDGERRALKVAVSLGAGFSLALGLDRERLRYASPLEPGCQPDARFFFAGIACQLQVRPRGPGQTTDKAETFSVDVRFHRPISDRFHLDAELGYGRLAWQTRDDVEAIAVGRCLAIDPTFDMAPLDRLRATRRIPECRTSAGSNLKSGPHGSLQLSYRLAGPVWLAGGYTVQRYAWLPYRHLAYNRFREANGGCLDPQNCFAFGWYRTRIRPDHPSSTDFFTAAVGSRLGRHFHAALSYEFGGSRDWDVLGARLGWWF